MPVTVAPVSTDQVTAMWATRKPDKPGWRPGRLKTHAPPGTGRQTSPLDRPAAAERRYGYARIITLTGAVRRSDATAGLWRKFKSVDVGIKLTMNLRDKISSNG